MYLYSPILEGANVRDLQIVEVALRSGEEHHRLLLPGERLELRLLEQFRKALAAVQLLLGQRIEVGAELRERRQLAVLRQDPASAWNPPA